MAKGGKLVCAITGTHKWSEKAKDDDNVLFQRIDCVRCGFSVDGAKVRMLKRHLGPDHFMLKKLP